jgi:dUTP pyrophosphatase
MGFCASDPDAGWDLFYCGEKSLEIRMAETVIVPTGIALVVDQPFVAIIKEKSGLAIKGISVHAGVVDSGYRGEIQLTFNKNAGVPSKRYEVGERVGQIIIMPYPEVEFVELDNLSETVRGEGGFGSSGK